jgi:hypothetical protein
MGAVAWGLWPTLQNEPARAQHTPPTHSSSRGEHIQKRLMGDRVYIATFAGRSLNKFNCRRKAATVEGLARVVTAPIIKGFRCRETRFGPLETTAHPGSSRIRGINSVGLPLTLRPIDDQYQK